jgi:YVTN family beta-propeller protein
MKFLLVLMASAAAASTVAPGDAPLNLIEAGERYLISSNSGYGDHFLQSWDEVARSVVSRLEVPSLWYGLAYDPESKLLLAASGLETVYAVPFKGGRFGKFREIRLPGCRLTAGIALQSGSTAVVACNQSHEVVRFNFESGAILHRAPSGEFPYAVRSLPQSRVAVSNWGEKSVSILDGRTLAAIARIPTGSHPNDLLLLPGGDRLAVACSDSDSLDFLDLVHLRRDREIDLRIPDKPLSGAQPDALAYDAALHRLYAGLAAVDAVAMFRLNDDDVRFEGVIPTNPSPNALVLSQKAGTLFYASGRNPAPGPNAVLGKGYRYIGYLVGGGIAALSAEELKRQGAKSLTLAKQIYGMKPILEDAAKVRTFSSPKSPIRHVIYVIKENRTYDQILGDVKEGNGAPDLVLFGYNVTPNHHKLATQFVLFDNFYVDGYVSADGHLWSTAAVSTDYVNKLWPSAYSKRADEALDAPYDGDDQHDHPIAAPGSGFIWDRARKAGITYRDYGEWNISDKNDPKHDRNYLAGLKDHFDSSYQDQIGEVTDQARVNEFEREFRQFERNGNLPQLLVMHLPNDHTMGTKPGYPTPTAMVADNDLALGRLVEIVSKSRYWSSSAIFVLEDDAQDGPDHVDARRSVLLAISPYTRRGAVSHGTYSTVSVLRTINQILGLGSLTYFDDRASGLLNEFGQNPSNETYTALKPLVNLDEKNGANAPGSSESAQWDFSRPDRAPDAELNRVIWQSVKGADSSPPSILSVRTGLELWHVGR